MIIRTTSSLYTDKSCHEDIKDKLKDFTIKSIKKNEMDVVNWETDRDDIVRISYQDRLKSAAAAITFICSAYFNNEDEKTKLASHVNGLEEKLGALSSYAQFEYLNYKKRLDDITPKSQDYLRCEKILVDYLNRMVSILETELGIDFKDAIELIRKADNYVNLISKQKTIATISEISHENKQCYIVQLENPLPPFDKETAAEYCQATSKNKKDLPPWFEAMSAEGKICFLEAMRQLQEKKYHPLNADDILELISGISSKEREIPGVANVKESALMLMDDKFNVLYRTTVIRSAHTATRDVKDKTICLRFAKNNLKHIIKLSIESKLRENKDFLQGDIEAYIRDLLFSKPIVHQTLVSPFPAASKLKLIPDEALDDDKLAAIQALIQEGFTLNIEHNNEIKSIKIAKNTLNILPTNHPLNMARHVMSTDRYSLFSSCRSTAKNIQKLSKVKKDDIAKAKVKKLYRCEKEKECLDALKNIKRELRALNDHAPNFLQRIYYFFFKKGQQRELHLATLTEFIAYLEDVVLVSSCVSGKDREALKILLTFALHIYVYQNKNLPNLLVKKEREEYIAIFEHLYMTWHQQVVAGQLATGANGGKTPMKYLGQDIINYFVERGKAIYLKISEKLADLNDFDTLLKKKPNPIWYQCDYNRYIEKFEYTPYIDSFSSLKTAEKSDDIKFDMDSAKIMQIIQSSAWNKMPIQTMSFYPRVGVPQGINKLRHKIKDNPTMTLKALSESSQGYIANRKIGDYVQGNFYLYLAKLNIDEKDNVQQDDIHFNLKKLYLKMIVYPQIQLDHIKKMIYAENIWPKDERSLDVRRALLKYLFDNRKNNKDALELIAELNDFLKRFSDHPHQFIIHFIESVKALTVHLTRPLNCVSIEKYNQINFNTIFAERNIAPYHQSIRVGAQLLTSAMA